MIQRLMSAHAILCSLADRPGMLSALTKVLADHQANITYVDIHPGKPSVGIYFEFTVPDDPSTGSGSPREESRGDRFATTVADLRAVDGVEEVNETPSFAKIYGKRIIVMGGGAQVGQVAMGAITEADRHNIRGERISVDTIPLVGEQELAAAVRATGRLPRVKMLVLAGALMGGDIAVAVEEVRASGLPVISLNMAGSVPDAADLVVTDPVQAGVMAVMAVADTAKFDLMRQLKRRY
jgi:energy-converting hydrogenase B subunit Q